MATFLAVVDTGSLSAAGRRLEVPLPTVSRKVADLERHLGAQLLVRTSRRAEPTDAGRAYAAAARHILDQLEEAEQTAAGEYHEPRGALSVTAPTLLGELHVLPLAAAFLAAHPRIDLRLSLTDAPVNLAEEHVHVAVRVGELADSGLMARRVGAARPLTCASPDYLRRRGAPQAPEDLAAHDGVSFSGFAAFQWRYVRDGVTLTVEPRSRVTLNSAAAAIGAASAGLGVTRALDYQAVRALREGALVTVLDAFEIAPRPVHLVYTGQGRLPQKVRAFLDWMAPALKTRLADHGLDAARPAPALTSG